MLPRFVRLCVSLRCEEGQSMVEYATLLGFVALGVFLVLGLLGRQVVGMLQPITDGLRIVSGVS